MILVLSSQAVAFASVGVGVGTGRIEVKESLKAGGIYTLPPVTVFNTGTETATYTMAVTLNETQPQLKPNPAWFSFSPSEFTLEPKQTQRVVPTFHPPVRTPPGDYFAYLEAHPAKTVTQGSATVGIAAATKLSFSIKSSNLLFGVLYRIAALYNTYKPWSQIALSAILLAMITLLFNRFINLRKAFKAAWQAGRSKNDPEKKESEEKKEKKIKINVE